MPQSRKGGPRLLCASQSGSRLLQWICRVGPDRPMGEAREDPRNVAQDHQLFGVTRELLTSDDLGHVARRRDRRLYVVPFDTSKDAFGSLANIRDWNRIEVSRGVRCVPSLLPCVVA